MLSMGERSKGEGWNKLIKKKMLNYNLNINISTFLNNNKIVLNSKKMKKKFGHTPSFPLYHGTIIQGNYFLPTV